MQFKEKIGLGLQGLEGYGFVKKQSDKVYYETEVAAYKKGVQIGLEIVERVVITVSVKGNYFETKVMLKGKSSTDILGSHTYGFPSDMSIEKVLEALSEKIEALDVVVK